MIKYISLFLSILVITSCNLDVYPTDAINTETIANTSDGLRNVTNGNYSLFKDIIEFNGTRDNSNGYLRQYFQMSDFASDDIVCGQVTSDPFFYSFTRTHAATQSNARYFWYISYKIINGASTAIQIGESLSERTAQTDQLVGESYFLRAFCHFSLVRLFATEYSIDASAPGIILRLNSSESGNKARANVAETYDQVINDLLHAAELMNDSRGPQFASKAAAWALLSRVYLYKGDYNNAIEYANKVIESGLYQIASGDAYKNMYANAASSSESIWILAMTGLDNRGKFGSISSMIYSDGNSGWGEEFASPSYRALLDENPEDARHFFIVPLLEDDGNVAKKNGIDIYYITKFSFQDGDPNLASPILLRYSEMYLNRAEAYAHLGQDNDALNDVDEIRKNRGLENALYNGSLPSGKSLLDVVLDERRLELAFEGQRIFDIYRNKMELVREYWGYHIPGLTEAQIDPNSTPVGMPNTKINYTDSRSAYYIPIDEILANPLCTQNP